MQDQLRRYVAARGNLLVSGTYIGTDMQAAGERLFLADVLKVDCPTDYRDASGHVTGLGIAFDFYHQLNEQHYAATRTDVLMPASSAGNAAFPAMVYANGTSAAVAYGGTDYHAFTMGFPFECITDKGKRFSIMNGILSYLIPN